MTLACEDTILVDIVTVADVDAEDHVGSSLLIWELTFGDKAKLLFRTSDFEHKGWSRFLS